MNIQPFLSKTPATKTFKTNTKELFMYNKIRSKGLNNSSRVRAIINLTVAKEKKVRKK